jgi:hypothetical protein
MHVNAEKDRAKRRGPADKKVEGFMRIWKYLWKVYKSPDDPAQEKNYQSKTAKI